jgi:uncharacterized protein YjbI with pentapeptide repeats
VRPDNDNARASAGPELPPRVGDDIPVVSTTHYETGTLSWQIRPPQNTLVVVVKGSFDIAAEGPVTPCDESDFTEGERTFEDDPDASAVYPSDLALVKPKADVVLVGHAHAPGGEARGMKVTFQFGSAERGFARSLLVHGDRAWKKSVGGVVPGDPEPFARVPLVYERAYGGPKYAANPCGRGHGDSALMPNLELPGKPVLSPSDKQQPACFAPIAEAWTERWGKLGSYDRRWLATRWPYFAEDFDPRFFQAAPLEQQLDELSGDEPFRIEGVHPEHRVIRGSLPAVRPCCFAVERRERGGELRAVPLVLDTAVFDTDAMKLQLVWRGHLDVRADDAPEVQALFVTSEAVGDERMTVDEAQARLLAALARPEPEPAPEPEPPADPEPAAKADEPDPELEKIEATIAAHEAEAAKLAAAAGLDDAAAEPPPPPDPEALAEAMREAGAAPGEIEEVLEALEPPQEDEEPPGEPEPPPIRDRVQAMLLGGESFEEFDFEQGDLSGLDFSRRCLDRANLGRACFGGCSFEGASLVEAQAGGADLQAALLSNADLTAADLTCARLTGARFQGANLSYAELSNASGQGTVFTGAHGERTTFSGSDWTAASFDETRLERADFTDCRLDAARFSNAALEAITLYDAKGEAVTFAGASMPGARAEGAHLARCDFTRIEAPGSVFENALLDEADFRGANLADTTFLRATCRQADFTQATLTEARLARADLRGAKLCRANLMMATLESADLTIADLSGANLHAAGLWKAKLQDAKLDGTIRTQSTLAVRQPDG